MFHGIRTPGHSITTSVHIIYIYTRTIVFWHCVVFVCGRCLATPIANVKSTDICGWNVSKKCVDYLLKFVDQDHCWFLLTAGIICTGQLEDLLLVSVGGTGILGVSHNGLTSHLFPRMHCPRQELILGNFGLTTNFLLGATLCSEKISGRWNVLVKIRLSPFKHSFKQFGVKL